MSSPPTPWTTWSSSTPIPRSSGGPDEPEIGYRLRRSAWGKGYATEGSRALISKAFADHPVRRVLAETSAIHTASRRVMEKCGLRLVREFDAGYPPIGPDDVLSDVEYAIDRVEWERQSATRMENLP